MSNPQIGQWVQYQVDRDLDLDAIKALYTEPGEVCPALVMATLPGSGRSEIRIFFRHRDHTMVVARNQGDGPGTWRPIPVEIPTAHLAKHPDENLALGVADAYTAGMKVRDLEAQVRELEEALAAEREITRGQRATLDYQRGQIETLDRSIKFAHTQINELAAKVKNLEAMIQSMDEASRDRINRVTSLEDTIDELVSEREELRQRILDMGHEASAKVSAAGEERTEAVEYANRLREQLDFYLDEYRQERARLEASVQELTSDRDSLTDRLDGSLANEVKLIGERDKARTANSELRWQLEELVGTIDECHENEVRLVAERDMLKEATDTLAKGRSEATERALFLARDLEQARKDIDGLEETLAANREAPGLVRDLEMAGARIGEQAARIVGLEAELENSKDQFTAAARIVGQDTTAQIRIKELEDMLASNLNHLHGLERQLRATAKMLVESQQEAAARDREVADLQAEVEHRAGTYLASMDTLEARIHDLRMKLEDSATSEVRLIGERDYYQAQINRLAEHLGLTGGPDDEGGPASVAIQRLKDGEFTKRAFSSHVREMHHGDVPELEPDPQTEAARTMLADFLAEQEAERNAYYSPLEEQAQDLLEAVQIAVAGSGHQVLRDMARVLGALERMEEVPESAKFPIDLYEVRIGGRLFWSRFVPAGDRINHPIKREDGSLFIPDSGLAPLNGLWEYTYAPAGGPPVTTSGPSGPGCLNCNSTGGTSDGQPCTDCLGTGNCGPATPLDQVPLNESPFITEHGSGA